MGTRTSERSSRPQADSGKTAGERAVTALRPLATSGCQPLEGEAGWERPSSLTESDVLFSSPSRPQSRPSQEQHGPGHLGIDTSG